MLQKQLGLLVDRVNLADVVIDFLMQIIECLHEFVLFYLLVQIAFVNFSHTFQVVEVFHSYL